MIAPSFESSLRPRLAVETGSRFLTRLDIAVLLFVLCVGMARLPTPFGGDQALNLLIGQVIAEGGSPYRDVWDLKHPGVFFVFAAGGALFGFHELGIHLFELLWMLALAGVVRIAAGQWLGNRPAAALAPALTVGLYWALAGERYLTQTEALVGLPLLLSLWCATEAVRADRDGKLWLTVSGLAAGTVMVFKIPYIALPAIFWLLTIRERSRRRGESLTRAAAGLAPWVIAGALVPVLCTVAFLVQKGVAALVLWTFFAHPSEVWEVVPIEPRRLLRATRWFVMSFAPALALAAIAAGDAMRRRMDVMTAGLCAWLAAGTVLIAMQVISWWDYHFLLLLVPTGLLAARGVEVADRAVRAWVTPARLHAVRALGVVALVLLFAVPLGAAVRAVADAWHARFLPTSRERVIAYHVQHHPHHAAMRTRTAFLREPGSHPGPIYVIDTPAYYFHAARPPALPLLAPWFHPTDRLWTRLLEGLASARAPYVRVSDSALQAIVDTRPSLRERVAGLVPLVESRYQVMSRDEDGTWYVRRDLVPDGRVRE